MAINPFDLDVIEELRVLDHQSRLASVISIEEKDETNEEVFEPQEMNEMTEEEQSLVEKVIKASIATFQTL